jgi:hypothetical protein
MDAIYAGTAKLVATKFGEMTKVSFNRTDLEKLTNYMNSNDSEWVNLVIKEKKEKVEGKPTHYLQVDEWKPTVATEKKQYNPTVSKNEMVTKFENDALPF